MSQSFEQNNEPTQSAARAVLENCNTYFEKITAEYDFLIVGQTITYLGVTMYYNLDENREAINSYRLLHSETEETDLEIHEYLVRTAEVVMREAVQNIDSAFSESSNLVQRKDLEQFLSTNKINSFVQEHEDLIGAFSDIYQNPILHVKRYPALVSLIDINVLRIAKDDSVIITDVTVETMLREHQARLVSIEVFNESSECKKHSYVISSYNSLSGLDLAQVRFVPPEKPSINNVLKELQDLTNQIDEAEVKDDIESLKNQVIQYLVLTMYDKGGESINDEATMNSLLFQFLSINGVEDKISAVLEKHKNTNYYLHLKGAVNAAKSNMENYRRESDFYQLFDALERDASPEELEMIARIFTHS